MRTKLAYRPDIDGLRALAVLGAVFFHTFPQSLSGGFVGVDVFFVISGYLITSILDDQARSGHLDVIGFFSRRVRRVFPALLVLLGTFLFAGWLLLLSDEFRELGRQVTASMGFFANFELARDTGYFGLTAEMKPLLHLWSLGVEEQFYFLWPVILFGVHRLGISSVFPIAALAATSFAWGVFRWGVTPFEAFYFPQTRLWELAMGGLLAVVPLPGFVVRAKNTMALIGSGLVASAFFLVDSSAFYPGGWALPPTMGTALLIAAGPQAWVNRRILANPAFVYIGLISYPLYLWHWPVLYFRRVVGPLHPEAGARWVSLGITFVLAVLTFELVEKRARVAGRHLPLVCLVLAAGIGVAGYLASTKEWAPRSEKYGIYETVASARHWPHPSTGFTVFYLRNLPYLERGKGPDTVLFWGDSNALQYEPRVDFLFKNGSLAEKKVIFATVGGCPPVPGRLRPDRADCLAHVENLRELAYSADVETIVFSGFWIAYFTDLESLRFLSGLGELLVDLRRERKRVFVILNIPSAEGFEPRRRLIRTLLDGNFKMRAYSLNRRSFSQRYDPLVRELKKIAWEAGAEVIDPSNLLCDESACDSQTASGAFIYRDAAHLDPKFVHDHANFLDRILVRK